MIAEGDLEVKHLLTVTLETEVPRFDDAGVDWSNRDLVDLVTLNAEKVSDAGQFRSEDTPAGAPRSVKTNGLEPGVPDRQQAVLLGNLALEQLNLRAFDRDRRKGVAEHPGPHEPQLAGGVVCDHGDELCAAALLASEEGDHPALLSSDGIEDRDPERGHVDHWNRGQRGRFGVAPNEEAIVHVTTLPGAAPRREAGA